MLPRKGGHSSTSECWFEKSSEKIKADGEPKERGRRRHESNNQPGRQGMRQRGVGCGGEAGGRDCAETSKGGKRTRTEKQGDSKEYADTGDFAKKCPVSSQGKEKLQMLWLRLGWAPPPPQPRPEAGLQVTYLLKGGRHFYCCRHTHFAL